MQRSLTGLIVSVGMLSSAFAQDSWSTHRGSNQRTGTTTNARSSTVNFLLAWTLPDTGSVRAPVVVDNDNTGLTSETPAGVWKVPSESERANDPYRENPDTPAPYKYVQCVREPQNAGDPAPSVATFSWRSGTLLPGYYRIFVYVPSDDTRIGSLPVPYARRAEYVVTDSTGRTTTVYLDQNVGGWRPLSDQPFYHDGNTSIVVTLNNIIRRSSPDYSLTDPPIVAADAVRFVPDYGTVQASPVAIRSPLDPGNHLVYIANGNGTITCVENPVGTRGARVRWTLRVPDLPEQGRGQIFDDAGGNFTAGAFTPSRDLGDAYGLDPEQRTYHEISPTDDARNIQRAYWKVRAPTSGQYYVFAWFPSDDQNARQAEYVIENEGDPLVVRVDQRFGGRWVLLNQLPVPMRSGRTYEISVTNYSPEDVRVGAQRVIADAIRVVSAEGLSNAVLSTPAVGRVRVRDGNSTETRWVVVFGAQNGAVYAVDALGDGVNDTRPGETKVYWIVKPSNSTSFSYASPLILEEENLVVIGNPAGSVYFINTDLNPDNPSTYLRGQYDRDGAAFVSTPAYDPATQLVYIGSTEGGNRFGRLIALNFRVRDNPNTPRDERVAWMYPPEEENPIEPVTATPAVALGRVYFTTGGLGGGRLYAVKADNGSLVWARPALNAPTIPELAFYYSSPLVVENLLYRGINTNVVYVGGLIARIIAFNADTGELLHISENIGGQVFSSPVFTTVRDTNAQGDVVATHPAVVVATNAGTLLALHADEQVNSRGGKVFEGWDLYANTVFASPAVLDNWLYAADDAGIVYAYNVLGVASAPPETGLGERIQPPGETPTPSGSDYSKLKVSVTTRKELADAVANGTILPKDLEPEYPDALEWGDTFYVVLWNFKQGTDSRPLQVQVIGPGNTRVGQDYTITPRRLERDGEEYWVAVQSITIQSRGNDFFTPGPRYDLQVKFGSSNWTSDLALETPAIDRPGRDGTIETPPYGGEDRDALLSGAGWRFGVANPLELRGIGEVGRGGTTENLFNGNNSGRDSFQVRTRFYNAQGQALPVGRGEHGKSIFGDFEVRDRRTPQTPNPAPLAINVRAYVGDMQWQGGAASVIRPLPWEELPTRIPNRSPDYPDLSGRRVQMLLDGAIDLQRATGRLLRSGNTVKVQIDIPRFQPANLNGYASASHIYADSNNNGRFDGLESVLMGNVTQELRIEAYRVLDTVATVQPDERMVIEEQTIDFGSLPAGFGFNWGNLFANVPSSTFRPDNPIFTPFWKPFTVRNEGNVNLYPVYLGKAFNSPSDTVYLFSDMVSFFAGMPAWTTVVSTLDGRAPFWPQPNPFYLPTRTQPYPVLPKPQVGDYTATVLTIPAIPARRDPSIQYPAPVKPQVSIAIPPFQPMGVYSQLISPYRSSGALPGVVDGPFATPPVRVVVRVRETQLTGGTNRGVVPMIDPLPDQNAPRVSDITPAAFRDPATGKLHLYWASNRADPSSRPDSFYLYKATLNWNARGTLQNQVRTTNGWVAESLNRWWGDLFGPYPSDPNGNLFVEALGLGRSLTPAEIATIKHHRPFVRTTPNGAFLFWTGEVILRNQRYELLFYTALDPSTGLPVGDPQAVALDPAVPRSSLSITGVNGVGNWLFYVAAPSGRSQIFYIASEGDRFAQWRREQRLPLSPIVRSVESVAANLYRVSANPNNPAQSFVYLADVYFIGTVGDRSEAEILMQRFYVNPDRGTLLTLSDTRVEQQLGAIQQRFLPLVVDKVAQKDAAQNVWRVRHLDWASLERGWNSDPNAPDIDIKVNGVSVILQRDSRDPRRFVLQAPTVDEQTGLMQFVYNEPVRDASGQVVNLLPKGRIVVDPNNGTVRFVNFAPRLNDIVTVSYRPRVYRISAIAPGSAGSYSQLRAVFQRTMNPRHNQASPADSPVRKGVRNGRCELSDRPSVDRVWLLFRRSGAAPNSSGNFFFKTLRPGVRLQSPILTDRGRIPLQEGASGVAQGTNHAVVQLTANNPAGSQLGFYEYDAARGNIYFTTEDLGKQVQVQYIARDRAGNIVTLTETLVVRWIDEGNLARSFATEVEYTSPVPIDLPTNELYLWAMPNLEFRQVGSLFNDPYGGLDESLLLFWSSTRNGVGNIYAGAMQPRFYISPFDPDQD